MLPSLDLPHDRLNLMFFKKKFKYENLPYVISLSLAVLIVVEGCLGSSLPQTPCPPHLQQSACHAPSLTFPSAP